MPGSLRFYEDFSRVRKLAKQQISTAYKRYINDIQDNIKLDPRALWQYINMKKGKSCIPRQLFDGVERFDEPQAIVDAFANIFSRNFLPSGEINNSDAFSLYNSLHLAAFRN
ncbi:hypothetical protein QE152_g32447 [Popillia japonica]|uniref:Uncharacterized protein n=1 Tax=Popillia japonica TaxID=7064 RepID=A0AAW1IZS1_POPJA